MMNDPVTAAEVRPAEDLTELARRIERKKENS
jgi:hypothetical protein